MLRYPRSGSKEGLTSLEIPSWLSILLIVVLVGMCAFFSCTETSFSCLNKYKYRALAQEGNKTAKQIVRLSDSFNTTLVSVLIGYNGASIVISVLSTFLFLNAFKVPLDEHLLDENVVSLIASIAMAFVTFLFGDTIPKFVGKKIPDTMARVNVYPMTVFIILFYPLGLVFRGITWLFGKAFHSKEIPELTEEDFASAIDEAEDSGVFESNESKIIQNALEFDDTRVKEVLTPLRSMKMIDSSGLTKEKLLAFIKECPYSRIPVYYKDRNKIVGILVVKDFLSAYFSDPKNTSFISYVKKPYFVYPSIHIDDLIEGFREHHTQVAIVRNKDGVLGMCTTEDVLEELVGSIAEKNAKVEVSK